MDDAVRHGTLRCGEEINTNKLSEKQVESIYRRLVSGEDGKQIAIELGVSQPAISAIKTKKNWKWLTDRIDNETAIHG
jgi:FixJ family two-component response regulator